MTVTINWDKVDNKLLLDIARAAEAVRKNPPKKVAHPNDDKTWSQLFDINPELFGKEVK